MMLRNMAREPFNNENGISFAEMFTEYLSDITLEVEGIKVKSMNNDIQGINEHVARINAALLGIVDAKLDLAEKCNIGNISEITGKLPEKKKSDKREIFLTENMHVNKTQVVLAIKETLLELGEPTYEKVVESLYREYDCVLTDCYEHPEYLNIILKQIFGKAHVVIVELIKKHLEEYDEYKSVQEFLTVIAR
jgi:hypothetical protein